MQYTCGFIILHEYCQFVCGKKIMRTKIVDENLIIHTVPLAGVYVGQIELFLDIFFDKEYAEVEKTYGDFPYKVTTF